MIVHLHVTGCPLVMPEKKKEDFLEFVAITLLKDNIRILSFKSVFKSNDSKVLFKKLGLLLLLRVSLSMDLCGCIF